MYQNIATNSGCGDYKGFSSLFYPYQIFMFSLVCIHCIGMIRNYYSGTTTIS